MNAFGIFMIILTVAYVLYYATLITIDWNKKEPATQTVESVDVEGVIDQDGPIEEEEDVEEEEELLPDSGVVIPGSDTEENQDHTRFMPSSESASNVPDENPDEQEVTAVDETPIDNALAVERQAEGASHSASTSIHESANSTENNQQVPSVLPISPDGEKPTNEEPIGDEDFDPFSYTPKVSPYNVVSLVSQPKQRTEADDRADAVNCELEEPLINSYDDVGDGEMEQLMHDEEALNEKKIVYSHELQSL